MKFILAVSAIALATAPTSAQNVASPKAPAPVAAPAIAPAPKPPVRRVRVKRPISPNVARVAAANRAATLEPQAQGFVNAEIGSASCRERVCQYVWIWVVAVTLKKKRAK